MDALFKQQFSDFNEAETELHKSAKAAGYSLVIHTKKPSAANFHTVNFRCAKGRSFTPKKTLAHESKRRKTSTQMTSCPYKLIVQKLSRSSENSKWNITRGTLDKAAEHNHPPNNPAAFPKYRKHAIQRREAEIISRYKAGASPHTILAELRSDVDPEVQLISRQDVNNLLYTHRQIELCGKTPTAWLYEELEKSQDYWHKDLRDDYNRILCLFIAPLSGIRNFKLYPDVLLCDSTYKTNRFGMPLFNICGTSPAKKTFQVAAAFLNAEKEEQFTWALYCLVELIREHDISRPRLIITDRELALMNALERYTFLSVIPHILCRWHVSMNVLAKTKHHFPKATRVEGSAATVRNASFQQFLTDWDNLIDCATMSAFEAHLAALQEPGKYPEAAVQYALQTWITPWKEKLVRYYVDKLRHFNHRTTSIVESLHSSMKKFLWASTGDLATTFQKLTLFWGSQDVALQLSRYNSANKVLTISLHVLYSLIRHQVTSQAIELLAAERRAIERVTKKKALFQQAVQGPQGPPGPCSPCRITRVHGLPCRHVIWQRLHDIEPLKLEEIDSYWYWGLHRLRLDPATTNTAVNYPLEPLFVRPKGRPKGALGLEKSLAIRNTRREPILAERVITLEGHEAAASSRAASRDDPAVAAAAAAVTDRQQPPPPSTAPAIINTSRESSTTLGLRRLKAGDTYEPGTEMQRSYQRFLQHQEDVDDGEVTDIAGASTPRESSPAAPEDRISRPLTHSQWNDRPSQWSDTGALAEWDVEPEFEQDLQELATQYDDYGRFKQCITVCVSDDEE